MVRHFIVPNVFKDLRSLFCVFASSVCSPADKKNLKGAEKEKKHPQDKRINLKFKLMSLNVF